MRWIDLQAKKRVSGNLDADLGPPAQSLMAGRDVRQTAGRRPLGVDEHVCCATTREADVLRGREAGSRRRVRHVRKCGAGISC